MARFGRVSGDVKGNLQFLGQCTFTQGLVGVANGGDTYYVDSSRAASGSGDRWDQAYITIVEAVAKSLAMGGVYDTILVKGNETDETSDYAESVTVTAAQVGLRIIGVGNSPEGVLWTVGTAEGTILTVAAKDFYVSGFRFRPNGATSGKAIDLAVTALGSTIENCIIRSTTETALYGIYIESAADVTIQNCKFTSIATAIYGNASVKTVYRLRVLNCDFDDKVDAAGINISGRACVIKYNTFTSDTTLLIDTRKGGTGEMNTVTLNTLMCGTSYAVNCVGAASDCWIGNYCNKLSEGSETDASGRTITIPS